MPSGIYETPAQASARKKAEADDVVAEIEKLGQKAAAIQLNVADVSSFGGRVKQYEIAINSSVLKSNNITINDVFTALEKNNENTVLKT